MSDRQRLSNRATVGGAVSAVVAVGAHFGGAGADTSVVIAVAVAAVAAVVVAGVGKVRERRGRVRSRSGRRTTGGSALEWAGRLLPDAMAEEYIEEWRAWLADLHEAGEPWYRRLAELLVIMLVAAPRLAIICRLGPRRTVD